MSGASRVLRDSYDLCRLTARHAGSSFYPCFFLLPRAKRRAMYALYAFLRHTDDLGDNTAPASARREALSQWRASLAAALAGNCSLPTAAASAQEQSPQDRLHRGILAALADTVRQYQIPPEHLYAVIDGVEMDLDPRQYATFEELEQYCHRVASAVGLACLPIWGFRGDQALEPARKCGVAFQLTNILRDLKEDAASGRIYLPLEDLRQCDYSAEDLLAGRADSRFLRLMTGQIDRTRRFYREGAALVDHLEPDGKRVFGMMTATYRRLLDEIDRRRAEVLTRRIRLSRWQKLAIAARWFLFAPKNPL